jgi:hypothetical protein
MPTRKEAARLTAQENTLLDLGFTASEAESLRRISMTLRRWHELECGIDSGCIERDEKTGRPYWVNYHSRYLSANDPRSRRRIADREAGALRRLNVILKNVNARRPYLSRPVRDGLPNGGEMKLLQTYIQTDPRGAALYILRPGDVPAVESIDSYYSRGLCVY